ncbi:MAG: P-loop NTPase [Pirellulales bacterium]|nr:P-loop NTPase [Pirellulales bacterium]
MIEDQANGLRRLVRQEQLPREAPPRSGARLILVTGGKGGTGTTTIAFGLAAAAAGQGRQVVLVDANSHGGDIALMAKSDERWTIADVLSSRATVAEAIQPGAGGMRVLPGAWAQENLDNVPGAAHARLLDQLRSLEPEADDVFFDGGSGFGRCLRQFWHAAHVVAVVTTPALSSVMDTYATIKLLARGRTVPPVYTIVNHAASARIAGDVHARLARSCRRFLGMDLLHGGHVSEHGGWFGQTKRMDPPALTAGKIGREIGGIGEILMTAARAVKMEAGPSWQTAAERLTA